MPVITVPYIELRFAVVRGLQLSGYAPVANVGLVVSPAAATLSLTTSTPVVFIEKFFTVAVEVLVLDGSPGPTRITNFIRGPPATTLLVAGQLLGAAADTVVFPPRGVLSLTSQVPTVNITFDIAVGAAELKLTGHIPGNQVVEPLAAFTLSLAGYAPSITIERDEKQRNRFISVSVRRSTKLLYQ